MSMSNKIKSSFHYGSYKVRMTLIKLSGDKLPPQFYRNTAYHINMAAAYEVLDGESLVRTRVFNVLNHLYNKECMDYIHDIGSYSDWDVYSKMSNKAIYKDFVEWVLAS